MKPVRFFRIKAGAVLASLLLAALFPSNGYSQQPKAAQAKTPAVGALCSSKGDPRPGTIHKDACGRLYCMVDVKNDPLKYAPETAAKLGCEWKLVSDKCRCVFPSAKKTK